MKHVPPRKRASVVLTEGRAQGLIKLKRERDWLEGQLRNDPLLGNRELKRLAQLRTALKRAGLIAL